MKIFNNAIIGNAIIGTMIAYELSKKNNNTILIGPKDRKGSASTASGAMLNVFGEIDYDKSSDDYLEKKLPIIKNELFI